jgi:hypothetical protein
MKRSDDEIAAEELVTLIKAIADRWGFDWKNGNIINAAVSPSTEQAHEDVVTLVAMVIAEAGNRSPAVKKRFYYLFRGPKSE